MTATVWTPIGTLVTPTGANVKVHEQTVPAATWSITHGLLHIPHSVVVYVDGVLVLTDTEVSAVHVVLTFPSPVAGEAHIL
jgi:hypothetical protein